MTCGVNSSRCKFPYLRAHLHFCCLTPTLCIMGSCLLIKRPALSYTVAAGNAIRGSSGILSEKKSNHGVFNM